MLLYVDPGIGALLLQAVIAAGAGLWLVMRKSMRKVFFFWKKKEPVDK